MAVPGVGQAQADQIRQFREFLQSYNKITEICFADCVNDFTSRKVSGKENECSTNCLQKYLKATTRISQRFQEHLQQNTNLAPQPGFAQAQ